MAKKHRKRHRGSVKEVPHKSKVRSYLVFISVIVFILAGLVSGFYFLSPSGSANGIDYSSIKDPSQLRGGEKKPTLSPAYFVGQIARTYRIAREIPEVLDSLYCYCNCMIHSGHKSLLSCYTGLHAANCSICQEQALRAYELYREGMDIVSIRKAIDREFGS